MTKVQRLSLLEIVLIFIVPIIVLYTQVWPIELRHFLGLPVAIMLYFSIKRTNWNWRTLGVRADNLRSTFWPYAVFTIAVVAAILILARIQGRQPLEQWYTNFHFQFFFLATSFFQEFAFRGYLVPKLAIITGSKAMQVLINALLFTGLHFFFPQAQLILPLIFMIGVSFTLLYMKYSNLWWACLSHSIINFMGVLYCFASLDMSCF